MNSMTSSLLGISSRSSSSNGGGSRSNNVSNDNTNPILSLVRSLLQRVTNDVQTQSMICQFLQNVSLQQIQHYLQLLGVSNLVTVPTQYMDPVIHFCHSISVVRLQRMIFITQCIIYCRQIIQRILQILHKYHTILVLYLVNVWIHSSMQRPIPISKRISPQPS
jgi:hypothetical protein